MHYAYCPKVLTQPRLSFACVIVAFTQLFTESICVCLHPLPGLQIKFRSTLFSLFVFSYRFSSAFFAFMKMFRRQRILQRIITYGIDLQQTAITFRESKPVTSNQCVRLSACIFLLKIKLYHKEPKCILYTICKLCNNKTFEMGPSIQLDVEQFKIQKRPKHYLCAKMRQIECRL